MVRYLRSAGALTCPLTKMAMFAAIAALCAATAGAAEPIPAFILGQNVEHTRSAVQGGLSAQLVRNRKFAGKALRSGVALMWESYGTHALYDHSNRSCTRHAVQGRMWRGNERHSQVIGGLVADGEAGIRQGGIALRGGVAHTFKAVVQSFHPGEDVLMVLRVTSGGRILAEKSFTVNTKSDEAWERIAVEFTPDRDMTAEIHVGVKGRKYCVVGAVSLMPADNFHGMRADVVEHLREIGTSVVRWPGGNFAGEYRWRDGYIADPDERTPLQSFNEINTHPYTLGYDQNDIGTEDILALCEKIGAQPFFTINAAWEDPKDSADWVKACKERVKLWSLGNEMGYGHMEGPKDAKGYAQMVRPHAEAMLKVDPSLTIVSSGPYPRGGNDWLDNSAKALADVAPVVSYHRYDRPGIFDFSTLERTAALYERVDKGVDAAIGALRDFRKRLPTEIGISYDEWNLWFAWHHEEGIIEGLYAAKMLNGLMRNWEAFGLKCVCYFQAVNEQAICVNPFESHLTSAGEAMRLWKGHVGGVPADIPGLPENAFVTDHPDGSRYMTFYNFSTVKPCAFRILTGGRTKIISAETLVAPGFEAGCRYERCDGAGKIVGDFYELTLPQACQAAVLLKSKKDDFVTSGDAFAQTRTTTSLDGAGWKFARDNSADASLDASAPAFADSTWCAVEVPHDWAIEGPFDPALDGGTGKLPWRGVGWYHRTFEVSPDEYAKVTAGDALWLEFDGVMADGKVYVNGSLAGGGQYGYLGFRVDIAPFIKLGANTLAVRADTRGHRSRWYPGAGIYRSVRLVHAPAVHVVPDSAFVTTPRVSKEGASVHVAFTITNRLAVAVEAAARVQINLSGTRKPEAEAGGKRAIPPHGTAEFTFYLEVACPRLWDVESPNLYNALLQVATPDATDAESVRFGIRTAAFMTDDGFHLNGRRVQLHGVNLHSDLGPLGMAFNRSAMRRQLQIMKDMGVNALRTSHNAPAPQLLELCDEMGIVVWDECFDKWDGKAGLKKGQNMEEYIEENLRTFVLRDRNHPCVVVWSIGNEIQPYIEGSKWRTRVDGMTAGRFRRFRAAIRSLDTSRPVGIGCCDVHAVPTGMFAELDISGWNYSAKYKHVKAKNPDKPVLYTESASALSSYGHYELPPAAKKTDYENATLEVGAYEHNAVPWGDIADVEFARMEKDRYCGGEFVWTGIDYLGEPTPFAKQSRSSYFGICDLMALPKDRFWLYRSYWNNTAHTLHIAPHWNWEGYEGRNVPVYVYTDCDEAELFLNGKSLGRRRKGEKVQGDGEENSHQDKYYDVCDKYRLRWLYVPYQPGELKVVAYKAGKRVSEKIMRTAGQQAAVRLTPEMNELPPDGETVCFVHVDVVDANGTRDPRASNRVSFKLEGPGRILAVGNGDARGMDSFKKIDSHPLYNGKAVVVVRREKNAKGTIKLTATCGGLKPSTAVFHDFRTDS